ncbi:MAG: hypothetical protein QOI76_1052 [Frankiales bacterium]|jgi:hypothetical protein|nr:hypothetical protein [Frankiales bacterium]
MRVAARLPLLATTAVLFATLSPVSTTASATNDKGTAPAPTVSVTSPVAGSQVAGFVSVSGSATVDDADSDTAQTLQFYVDGRYVAQHSCSDGEQRSCAATFSWDTTSLYAVHALQLRLRTGDGVVVMSPAVTVQVGDAPTARLSSPAAGSTVTGVVSVGGGGTVDALQPDTVKALQLLVDGSAAGSTACPGGKACTGSFPWDTTGLSGLHTLQLKLTTNNGQTGLSPVMTVAANSPAPAVVLTAGPASSGVLSVKVIGTVDASQTDAGASVRLLADGKTVGTASCPDASKSCSVTINVNAKHLAGQHNLQAQFTTTAGRTASSADTPVWFYTEVKVTLDKLPKVVVGRLGTVSGRVSGVDGRDVPGARVRVLVQNSLGRAATAVTVVTGPTGAFTATYKAVSNTVVTATVVASSRNGAGTATVHGLVAAAPTCTLKLTIARGAPDPVACRLGDVPTGTAVALQSRQGGKWRNLSADRSAGQVWAFGQVFTAKGPVFVRLSMRASKDFAAGVSAPVKVTVT